MRRWIPAFSLFFAQQNGILEQIMAQVQTFQWPIVGHRTQQRLLQQAISSGTVSHAYLFYGGGGVGKKYMSRIFIQTLLCSATHERPCGACNNCLNVSRERHVDVLELKAEVDTSGISVDQIRTVHSFVYTSALGSANKVVLIHEADCMTLGAANALLKILEEPPRDVVVILLAASIDTVPATVVSRCIRMKFGSITREEAISWSRSHDIGDDRGYQLFIQSAGRIGSMNSMFNDEISGSESDMTRVVSMLQDLFQKKRGTALAELATGSTRSFLELQKAFRSMLQNMELAIRDIVANSVGSNNVIHRDLIREFAEIGGQVPMRKIVSLKRDIAILRRQLDNNANPQLMFHQLTLAMRV